MIWLFVPLKQSNPVLLNVVISSVYFILCSVPFML